ncbi:MAG: fumarylacetoacetate hydrolase family protein [Rhodobacteraceae bacterium]|nr:fumarylacetoacetate hydrolase family protein [Paracoccaceae bacterium]
MNNFSDWTENAAWALATISHDGQAVACLETDAGLFRLAPSLARAGGPAIDSVVDLFPDWERMAPLLDAAAAAVSPRDALPADAPRLSPLRWPGKVLCAGANYYRHLEEMGVPDTSREGQRLFFFFKPPRNALVGSGEGVRMPLDTGALDWEVELAAVIGRTARAVPVEEALSHVAAWSVAIDFSARDLNQAPQTFYKLDWVAGKAQDSCCPLGPRLVPAAALGDPQAVPLRLKVNGDIRQDDTTADMIFSVAEQIATLSRIMTLDPGDVLLTGTPAGVGAPKKTFLSVGDRVEAEIGGIGALAVTIHEPA